MKRKTQSYTAPPPRTPPKRKAPKRKREAWPVIDASAGPVVLEDRYTPDGSDPDDT